MKIILMSTFCVKISHKMLAALPYRIIITMSSCHYYNVINV